MAFTSKIQYPIAVTGTALNVFGIPFAVLGGEPWHATTHAVLALAFGLWTQHLRFRRRVNALEAAFDTGSRPALAGAEQARFVEQARIADLEAELDLLRQELGETQERLDFTERVMARESERAPERRPVE